MRIAAESNVQISFRQAVTRNLQDEARKACIRHSKHCQLKSTTMYKKAGKALMLMGISFVTGVHPSIRQTIEQSPAKLNESVLSSLDFK
jgi:hypothetical protein